MLFTDIAVEQGSTITFTIEYNGNPWSGIDQGTYEIVNTDDDLTDADPGPGADATFSGNTITFIHDSPECQANQCDITLYTNLVPPTLDPADWDLLVTNNDTGQPADVVFFDGSASVTITHDVNESNFGTSHVVYADGLLVADLLTAGYNPPLDFNPWLKMNGPCYDNASVPPDTPHSFTSADCVGSYTVTLDAMFEVSRYDPPGLSYGVITTPFTTYRTFSVIDEASLTSLTVKFFSAIDGSEITNLDTASVEIDPEQPTPPRVEISGGNELGYSDIVPDYYGISINPPDNWSERGEIEDGHEWRDISATMSVPSFNLTTDRIVNVHLCPLTQQQGCEPDSDLGTEIEPPEETPPISGGEDPIEAADLCIPEEMLEGALGWILRPVFKSLCAAVDITAEVAIPLLDVNIPLVVGHQWGGTTTLELRTMFSEELVPATGTNLTAQALDSFISEATTPIEVYQIWEVAYALSRSIVMLMMALTGLAIIFRLDPNKYSHKTYLTNTIIGIMLATFSYNICVLMFDVAKILAFVAKDILMGIFVSLGGSGHGQQDWATDILQTLVGLVAFAKLTALSGGLILLAAIPCLCGLIGYVVAIIALFAALLARILFLYIMVVISPLVFVAGILPPFKEMTKAWFTTMAKLLLVFPLVVMLYYLFMTLGHIFNN
ncbi:MAG TPA: hypothetical protein PKL83_04450 [bacterium]|nr:hypothetical protein [bacterium]